MEIWKNINKEYQVSNLGRVKSKYRKGTYGKTIKQWKDKHGYLIVYLSKNGKSKKYKVHRLVAEAFIPNLNNLPCINHRDENKLNNRTDNLEWCTYKYNNNYGTKKAKISKANSKQVLCIELDIIYCGTREASRKTGICQCNISQCCNGKRQMAGKYHWKYVEKC